MINAAQISARTLPQGRMITAGGGWTTPQHVFIPHPATQPFSGHMVPNPAAGFGYGGTYQTLPYHADAGTGQAAGVIPTGR